MFVHLLLFDISKASDRLYREMLIKGLQHTIEADEIHIIYQLLNVTLLVKCLDHEMPSRSTPGAPQKDCARANQFICYLEIALLSPLLNFTKLLDH